MLYRQVSHPSWVRGLKLYVALGERLGGTVAPLAGAWIETVWKAKYEELEKSHPSWVRGLKRPIQVEGNGRGLSHPSWVRGLKQVYRFPL